VFVIWAILVGLLFVVMGALCGGRFVRGGGVCVCLVLCLGGLGELFGGDW